MAPSVPHPRTHARVTTVWVASLPRSYSSCTMRILEGAGFVPFQDAVQRALPSGANPYGFYESSALNHDPVATLRGLDLSGRCLKVFAKNVRPLLVARILPTHVILLRRPIEDVHASWKFWFRRLRMTPGEMVATLDVAEAALRECDIPILVVPVYELIDDATEWCGRISEFLGGGYDTAAMAALVDPALSRFRGNVSPQPPVLVQPLTPVSAPSWDGVSARLGRQRVARQKARSCSELRRNPREQRP